MAKTLTLKLPDELENQLSLRADSLNLSLEAFILETLSQSLPSAQPIARWPEIILNFKGIPDFPPFESYRDELLPPREPEVF